MILLSVIILFFLLLFSVMVAFIVLRFKRNKAIGTVFGIVVVCISLFVLSLRISFPYWSIGSRHLWYTSSVPNLHSRLILEPYDFTRKNFSAEYEVSLKYLEEYSVGICLAHNNFPKDFEYKGKIKVELFQKDKLICSYISGKIRLSHEWIDEKGELKLVTDKVGLVTYDMAELKKYRGKLKVKVTVVKPDEALGIYDGNLRIYVGIDRLL